MIKCSCNLSVMEVDIVMIRTGKGHGIGKYLNDYCVLDLETTGTDISHDKIIEIGIIKVINNEIIDTYSSLVNPGCSIPTCATDVNHITNEMVENAPCFKDIVDAVLAFIGDSVIVGYNNAGFDMLFLYDAILRDKGIEFKNDYIDVLHAARRCMTGISSYKLESLCKYYGFDITGEHRALKDCYLTKQCYDMIHEKYGNSAFEYSSDSFSFDNDKGNSGAFYKIKYSADTVALQELQDILNDMVEDGKITLEEFSILKNWMDSHMSLRGSYPFDKIYCSLNKVLENGIISQDELDDLQVIFSEFVDPVKCCCSKDELTMIAGKNICVTGDFDYGDRNTVLKLIENAGGLIDKSVKKTTDYLIVGSKGSDNWKTGNYGGKIQKAMQYKDKGINIEIIEEDVFIPCITKIIENSEADHTDTYNTIDMNAINTDYDWISETKKMLNTLVDKYELPKGSLYLSHNTSRDDPNTVISYSICIWEPNFPPLPNEKPGQNKIVATLNPSTAKSRPDDLDISIREVQEGDLRSFLPTDATVIDQTKSDIDSKTQRLRFNKYSLNLVEYLKHNTEYCIKGYVSKADRFGCCDSFIACSDALKCVHPNKLYSKACMYRSNLEQGRVFYGKNQNYSNGRFIVRKEIAIGSDTITLDSEKQYTGSDEVTEQDKLIRKILGLPITKALIYYKDKYDTNSVVNVKTYRIVEMYETWYTIELSLEDGTSKAIHSGYLSDMQKPSFIADMAAQSV